MKRNNKTVPEHVVPEEYTAAPQTPLAPEYRELYGEQEVPDEAGTAQGRQEEVREDRFSHKMKKRALMTVASAVVAVSVIYTSYGIDLLGMDVFKAEFLDFHEWMHHHGGEPYDYPDPYEPDFIHPDPIGGDSRITGVVSSFPQLTNLAPNGDVPGYGILNEEYIAFMDNFEDMNMTYIYCGSRRLEFGIELTQIDGVSYDYDSNTLTLTNFTGTHLSVNLMGNGFKLKVIGDNYLDSIRVFGFHYGGSLLITGSGTLIISQNGTDDLGISLMAEDSPSCLMIDNTVTVKVYGLVQVSNSTMEQGIYVLSPSSITGGTVRTQSYQDDGNTIYYHSVADSEGYEAVYVEFSS